MHGPSNTVRTRTSSITETRSIEGLSPPPAPSPRERNSSANHNTNHENEISPRQSEPGTSMTLPRSTDTMTIPPTLILSPASLPAQKPRIRKPTTKETAPPDSQSLTDLGMSPFMPVQDAIFNQNRLVRNEAILAQHVSRLQRSHSMSESNHAQRAQDIYRILTDHKALIDKYIAAPVIPSPIRSDSDFAALFDAHVETRIALNTLIRKYSSLSASTKTSIDQLNESIRRLTAQIPTAATEDSARGSTNDTIQTQGTPQLLHSASNFSLPEIVGYTDYSVRGKKRKREDSNPDPSPGTNIGASIGSPVTAHGVYLSRSDYTLSKDTSKDVLYGPVNNASDHLNAMAIVNEAISSVGLSPSMVQSILPAPGNPDFLSLRFLKYEYASRFVDLVAFGLDSHPSRQAFFADGSSNLSGPATPGVASSSKSKLWKV